MKETNLDKSLIWKIEIRLYEGDGSQGGTPFKYLHTVKWAEPTLALLKEAKSFKEDAMISLYGTDRTGWESPWYRVELVGTGKDGHVKSIYSYELEKKIRQLQCPHTKIDIINTTRIDKRNGEVKYNTYTKCLLCNEIVYIEGDRILENIEYNTV